LRQASPWPTTTQHVGPDLLDEPANPPADQYLRLDVCGLMLITRQVAARHPVERRDAPRGALRTALTPNTGSWSPSPEAMWPWFVGVTRDDVLGLCASFPGAIEDYPFGDEVAVYKAGGRMFALVALDGEPGSGNLKCDPELALELRTRYPAIRPGYHQNKRHWNTVELDCSVPEDDLREMVEQSYELVIGRLPRAERARLGGV